MQRSGRRKKPVGFQKQTLMQKKRRLLSWLVNNADIEARALAGQALIQEEEVEQRPENVSNAVVDPKVNVYIVKGLFTEVQQTVQIKQGMGDNLPFYYSVEGCDSELNSEHVQCDFCLSCSHVRCVEDFNRGAGWFFTICTQ